MNCGFRKGRRKPRFYFGSGGGMGNGSLSIVRIPHVLHPLPPTSKAVNAAGARSCWTRAISFLHSGSGLYDHILLNLCSCSTKLYIFKDTWAQYQLTKIFFYFLKYFNKSPGTVESLHVVLGTSGRQHSHTSKS